MVPAVLATLACPRIMAGPAIDGRLGDAAWAQAGRAQVRGRSAWAAVTEKELFVALRHGVETGVTIRQRGEGRETDVVLMAGAAPRAVRREGGTALTLSLSGATWAVGHEEGEATAEVRFPLQALPGWGEPRREWSIAGEASPDGERVWFVLRFPPLPATGDQGSGERMREIMKKLPEQWSGEEQWDMMIGHAEHFARLRAFLRATPTKAEYERFISTFPMLALLTDLQAQRRLKLEEASWTSGFTEEQFASYLKQKIRNMGDLTEDVLPLAELWRLVKDTPTRDQFVERMPGVWSRLPDPKGMWWWDVPRSEGVGPLRFPGPSLDMLLALTPEEYAAWRKNPMAESGRYVQTFRRGHPRPVLDIGEALFGGKPLEDVKDMIRDAMARANQPMILRAGWPGAGAEVLDPEAFLELSPSGFEAQRRRTASTMSALLKKRGAEIPEALWRWTVAGPEKPWLGVLMEGVRVTKVFKGSPAAQADVQPGDVLQALEGKRIEHAEGLRITVEAFADGSKVTLTLQRGQEMLKVPVTLVRPEWD